MPGGVELADFGQVLLCHPDTMELTDFCKITL